MPNRNKKNVDANHINTKKLLCNTSTQTDVSDEDLLPKVLQNRFTKFTFNNNQKKTGNTPKLVGVNQETNNICKTANNYSDFVGPITTNEIASSTLCRNANDIREEVQPPPFIYCRKFNKSMNMVISLDTPKRTKHDSINENDENNDNNRLEDHIEEDSLVPVMRNGTPDDYSHNKRASLHLATIVEQDDETPSPDENILDLDVTDSFIEEIDMETQTSPHSIIDKVTVSSEKIENNIKFQVEPINNEKVLKQETQSSNKKTAASKSNEKKPTNERSRIFNVVKIGKARKVFVDTHFH